MNHWNEFFSTYFSGLWDTTVQYDILIPCRLFNHGYLAVHRKPIIITGEHWYHKTGIHSTYRRETDEDLWLGGAGADMEPGNVSGFLCSNLFSEFSALYWEPGAWQKTDMGSEWTQSHTKKERTVTHSNKAWFLLTAHVHCYRCLHQAPLCYWHKLTLSLHRLDISVQQQITFQSCGTTSQSPLLCLFPGQITVAEMSKEKWELHLHLDKFSSALFT